MPLFNPKYPRGAHPCAPQALTQHVLITNNGTRRTSNVSHILIMKAVYEIEANGYVTLEKCIPVRLVSEAESFAMSFYKDSRIAVYFRVRRSILRMCRDGFTPDDASDMMCDYFRSAKLPDMTGWVCEELKPAPQKAQSSLSVDGEDFRHFVTADVMAALENIIEGKSRWMLHDYTGDNGGYMNIQRCDGESPEYNVEWVKWTEPTPTGFRATISDTSLLRRLLWDFVDERKYPALTPEWERFDVTDYFQRLVFKFSGKQDKSDNNENNDER